MFDECGPSASDPVLHLCGFLVHESDHLLLKLDVCFGMKYLEIHLVDLDFFQFVGFLVCQYLYFALVDFNSLRFCTFLKSAISV